MNFEIIATDPFVRKLKRLAKKYHSLVIDLAKLFDELEVNPTMEYQLGKIALKYDWL